MAGRNGSEENASYELKMAHVSLTMGAPRDERGDGVMEEGGEAGKVEKDGWAVGGGGR